MTRTIPDHAHSLQPNFILRDAVRTSDAEAVRQIVERTGFFHNDEIEIAVELVEERLKHGIDSGYDFLFADAGGQPVGYSCFGEIACTIGSYDLFWIAVDPRFQGQGIGRILVLETEARIAAAGGRGVYIDTSGREQYAPTRAFYERCGYHPEARLKDFYAPGDDRVIYTKFLAGIQPPSPSGRGPG